MATIYICDRCKATSETSTIKKVRIPSSGWIGTGDEVTRDLCNSCREEVCEYMTKEIERAASNN